jgi:hypothetical protein
VHARVDARILANTSPVVFELLEQLNQLLRDSAEFYPVWKEKMGAQAIETLELRFGQMQEESHLEEMKELMEEMLEERERVQRVEMTEAVSGFILNLSV